MIHTNWQQYKETELVNLLQGGLGTINDSLATLEVLINEIKLYEDVPEIKKELCAVYGTLAAGITLEFTTILKEYANKFQQTVQMTEEEKQYAKEMIEKFATAEAETHETH